MVWLGHYIGVYVTWLSSCWTVFQVIISFTIPAWEVRVAVVPHQALSVFQSFQWMWSNPSLWFEFTLILYLMICNIFSCVYWPFIYMLFWSINIVCLCFIMFIVAILVRAFMFFNFKWHLIFLIHQNRFQLDHFPVFRISTAHLWLWSALLDCTF